MKKQALAFSLAFALTVSIGYAEDVAMIAFADQPVAAPVVADTNTITTVPETPATTVSTDSAPACSLNQLAEELAALNEDESGTGPNLTLTTHDEASDADVDMAALYNRAVKAQRLAHLQSIRLAKNASSKFGFLVAANDAFNASHATPADVTDSAASSALAYDMSAVREIPAPLFNDDALTGGTLVSTPEPSTTALVAAGMGLLVFFSRKRAVKPKLVPVKA